MSDKPLVNILKRLKKSSNVSTDTALTERMGVPSRRIQTWRHRNSIPHEEIITYCQKMGFDLNYIFSGETLFTGQGQSGTLSHHAFIQTPSRNIPTLELQSDQIVDTLCIEKDWAKHVLGISPHNLYTIRIIGNNMSPWAADGDLVLIDLSLTTIVSDAPFILQYTDMLVPKRLTRLSDGTLVAKSDSQYCDDEIYPPDTIPPRIVGRIIRRLIR